MRWPGYHGRKTSIAGYEQRHNHAAEHSHAAHIFLPQIGLVVDQLSYKDTHDKVLHQHPMASHALVLWMRPSDALRAELRLELELEDDSDVNNWVY